MIDPRHEQTSPRADAPYWARGYELAVPDPDRDANHDFARFVVRMIVLGVVLTIAAFVIGLCSLVIAPPSFSQPFLGEPQIQYDPYTHPQDSKSKYADSKWKAWFDKLASGKGLCCSVADGVEVRDVYWTNVNAQTCTAPSGAKNEPMSGYCVRLDGQWLRVPQAAVVTEKNTYGAAVVWPILVGGKVVNIRCFMAGSGA